jgi:hypothetical protein
MAADSYSELHFAHLAKAAEHLTEAGLVEEAASVKLIANRLRQELIATKQAQIASLQAEIAELEAACDTTCLDEAKPQADASCKRINVQLKIVDVDLAGLEQLGFSIESFGATACSNSAKDFVRTAVSRDGGLPGFLAALEREKLATVLTAPAIEIADGQNASLCCKTLQTSVDVTATTAGQDCIRLHARPHFGRDAQGVDCELEIKPGDTAVLSGTISKSDREHQVLILVTPTPLEPNAAVRPVNFEEASSEPAAEIRAFDIPAHRTHFRGEFGGGGPMPNLIFSRPIVDIAE